MASDSFAADIDRLLAGSRQVIAAARPPEGMMPASGSSDLVRVTDGRGGRPEITIATAWERSVRASELGHVVSRALASFDQATRQAAVAEAPEPWTPTVPDRDLTPALNRLNAALAASAAQLSSMMRRLEGEPPQSIIGERGHVRIDVEDGRVGMVTIDPTWATGKSGATIAMEVGNVLADVLAAEPPPPQDPIVTDPYAALAFLKETL